MAIPDKFRANVFKVFSVFKRIKTSIDNRFFWDFLRNFFDGTGVFFTFWTKLFFLMFLTKLFFVESAGFFTFWAKPFFYSFDKNPFFYVFD